MINTNAPGTNPADRLGDELDNSDQCKQRRRGTGTELHSKDGSIDQPNQWFSWCIRTKSSSEVTKKLNNNNSDRSRAASSSPLERFITLLLPFIFVLLLPSIVKLPPFAKPQPDGSSLLCNHHNHHQEVPIDAGNLLIESHFASDTTSALLMNLLRLPFDRLKLQWGGLALLADGKEINKLAPGGDLLEEETHMMLLAPAEHRSGYAQGPQGSNYHYNSGGGDSAGVQQGGSDSAHGQPNANLDYGPEGGATASETSALGSGQGEPSVVAESAAGPHGGASSLQTRSDLPAVRALNVKCEKNHMTVNIVFDRPFHGMVFSKGHYNDQKCVHLPPNSGQTSVNFDIHLGKCGMSSSGGGAGTGLQTAASSSNGLERQSGANPNGQQPNGVFIENTIIIQYDPQVQEIYDQARKLRCTWYDYYEKSVTFRPYNVDMLDAVTANFLGDNIQCWMQIQVGKGPWSSEVAGIVKIGQTMTMVLAIRDDENRFDMLVRNCVAHDGKHQPIQLVDEYGCVARPKIMGRFQKAKNFGPTATVVSYAHFQAFKFPDSMNVHFQCVIQVCRYECPEPVCPAGSVGPAGGGELGASSGGTPPQNSDYATSGTELVASKEILPHHNSPVTSGFFNPTAAIANHSTTSHGHGSNVNLKLDESQGPVQVRLTSMLAATGSNGRPSVGSTGTATSGPLPPHLLYANQDQVARTGFRQPPALSVSSSGGSPSIRAHYTQSTGSLAAGNRLPHDHQQVLSFSPQFPMTQAARRSAYTSRLGEMAASKIGETNPNNSESAAAKHTVAKSGQLQHALDQLAPYESEYPLSLIASPRGFRLGSASGLAGLDHLQQKQQPMLLHRVKRDEQNANKRQARHLKSTDSTSVETHKSIQVVSPDDVAFSLLEPTDSDIQQQQLAGSTASKRRLTTLELASSSSVCFSAARFMWAVLVTLVALVGGVVIVTYVILKQRSQLGEKLSAVQYNDADKFQAPQGLSLNYNTPMVSQSDMTPSPPLQQHSNGYFHLQQQRTICPDLNSGTNMRQQDEVQQRNKYLARFYSQFSPAAYWR